MFISLYTGKHKTKVADPKAKTHCLLGTLEESQFQVNIWPKSQDFIPPWFYIWGLGPLGQGPKGLGASWHWLWIAWDKRSLRTFFKYFKVVRSSSFQAVFTLSLLPWDQVYNLRKIHSVVADIFHFWYFEIIFHWRSSLFQAICTFSLVP